MKLGLGTTVLARGVSGEGIDGIGAYTREIGRRLAEPMGGASLHPASFGARLPADYFPGAEPALDLGPYGAQAAWAFATARPFPAERRLGGNLDIFHAPDHLIPRFAHIPVLATLMDAIPLSHPQWVPSRWAPLKRLLWRRAAHWADHIVTISEYSKVQIIDCFDVFPEKISVVPLGVDERFFERFCAAERAQVRSRLGLPERFFLNIGTLQPRKNLERVLDAHAALPPALQQELPLVVVGRPGWACEALVQRLGAAAQSGRVRWLRYQPDRELRCLMQCALALVHPSLAEGFGLPVLEAFASGLPVITSSTTSLPEVAGDAALLVDPQNVGAIAHAMQQLAQSPQLAGKLAQAGERRAQLFRWHSCVEQTRSLYHKLAA